MLLNLDYAKFGAFNLFFQKLSKNNLLVGSARPLLIKEGLRTAFDQDYSYISM